MYRNGQYDVEHNYTQMDLSFTAEQTTVSWRPDPFAMATNQLGGTEKICLSPICFNRLVPAEDQNREVYSVTC